MMVADATMPAPNDINDLEDLLARIEESVSDQERVTLDQMISAIGRRSFGPLLLLAGLISISPIDVIPGIPTMVAVLVLTVTLQIVFRRQHIWLPGWLLRRSVSRKRLCKALRWLQRPARVVDRFIRPRLTRLTNDTSTYLIAIASAVIACVMPVMEVVPFSANIAGAALAAFGLALIAHDGVLALIALVFTAGAAALIVSALL
jgi:hypothetical protein